MTVEQTNADAEGYGGTGLLGRPQASMSATSRDAWILIAIGAVLTLGTFFASRGITVIDEIIYLVGAGTLSATGSQLLDNGYDAFPFVELTFANFFQPRPSDGLLASQYPIGQPAAGAVLQTLFGPRGLFFLNAAMAVVALFATYALALRLFADRQIALTSCLLLAAGTFLIEYVYGYWPHMISVAAVLVCFNLSLRAAAEDKSRDALRISVVAGLVLGAGMLFRVDCILLLPVIALLAITIAQRPAHIFAGGALGLLPAVAVLSWTNHVKFGTYHPLSYGPARVEDNLTTYLPLIAAGVAVLGVAVAWRCMAPRSRTYIVATCLGLAVLATIAVPQIRAVVFAYIGGLGTLVVDMTTTGDGRANVVTQADGTVLFWGLAKKALGQSLPWIGLLVLLALPTLKARRGAIAILLTLSIVWISPFAFRSWHGGLAANMRYFLPMVPALCILGAAVLHTQLSAGAMNVRTLLIAAIAGCLIRTLWATVHPTGDAGAGQILSLYVLAGCFVVGLLALFLRTPNTARASVVAFGVGIGIASANLVADVSQSQQRRERIALIPDFETQVSGEIVVMDHLLMSAIGQPDQFVALTSEEYGPGPEFLSALFAAGLPVAMKRTRAEEHFSDHPMIEIVETNASLGSGFVGLKPRETPRP